MTYIGTNDYFSLVAKGLIPGESLIHKFGRNDALPNGSFAFVTMLQQTAHVLSAATTVRVKAGNAADTAAGNGAREITIQGIDSTFAEIQEPVATAGESASSSTSASFWRVHRAWNSQVGVYGSSNTAAVVIENTAGNADILTIAAGQGQSQDAVWTVPDGYTAHLLSVDITVDATLSADVALYTRDDIDDTSAPMPGKRLRKYWDGIAGVVPTYKPRAPWSARPGKSDIWVEAQGVGANVEISVDFELHLVAD